MMLERREDRSTASASRPSLVAVTPGSLGAWSDEA
jgi:hypothetical protein